jgi:glutamine synthetase
MNPHRLLRAAWCDWHGLLRSKSIVGEAAQKAAVEQGLGFVGTLALKDSSDRTAFPVFGSDAAAVPAGLLGAGNLHWRADRTRLHRLPWAEGCAWQLGMLCAADGSPHALEPRGALLEAVAALARAGWRLRVGLEIEFHVYRQREGAGCEASSPHQAAWPGPAPEVARVHPGYQLLSDAAADACHEVLAVVQHTAEGLGLPLRSLEIEFGPSQFEAVFDVMDALAAADAAVLFRNGVKQALSRAGYHASFMCRPPFPAVMSSGWHLHQSLVHLDGSAAPSAHTLHWLAGLLAHAPGCAALAVPTINGYARFQPNALAPTRIVAARDDRSAMVRVLGNAEEGTLRLENRLPEPAANPYLLIASQIFAGLDGLSRTLAAPTRAESLPASLQQALAALAQDEVLCAGLGRERIAAFMGIKRQEIARHAAAQDGAEWEKREYFARC